MSAISDFINQIRTAIYGEQVRASIANAIEQCYDDVTNPSLNSEAFETALNNAYASGILDIQTVTLVSQMTNNKIIYRYNGNESGYVANTLYYHNGTNWVPVGSGVRSVSLVSEMTETGTIYLYTGSESGYKPNTLYYHNGTDWVPISPEEYTTANAPSSAGGNMYNKSTMTEAKAITTNGLVDNAGSAIANIPVVAGNTYSAQMKSLAWSGTVGLAFLDSSDNMLYYANLASTIVNGYAVLNKPVRIIAKQGSATSAFITRDISEKGICFQVPASVTNVAIQIKATSYDSTDDFMIEAGQICSEYMPNSGGASGRNITTIFGYPLADTFLRTMALKKSDVGYYNSSSGKNKFDITSMILGGYLCNSGNLVAQSDASNAAVALVPVTGGKTYSIQRKYANWAGNGAVVLLDSEMNQLYAVQFTSDGTNGDYKYPLQYRIVASSGQTEGGASASADSTNKGVTVVTSSNTAFIAFNFSLSGSNAMEVQVEEGSTCTAYEPYSAYGGTEISTILGANLVDVVAREALGIDEGGSGGSSGKKYEGIEWVSIGDSITVGGGGGGGYYASKVANDLGFTHINAAHSGVPYGAVLTQAEQITESTKICTIMLGTNNSTETDETIGQIGDTTTATVHGCIYAGINKILTEHPNIILGIIVPVPRYRTASEHESVRKVAKAINEACEYYCIPHLDLHGQIGFAEQVKDIYYQADYLHPSVAGANRMALAIEQWMESLLGDL